MRTFLKLIAATFVMGVVPLSASGDIVGFNEDFVGGTLTANAAPHLFGNGATTAALDLLSGSNTGGANVMFDPVAGTLSLGTTPNSRGLAQFIDADGTTAGNFTFNTVVDTFDNTGPQVAGARVFLVSGIDADSGVSLDLHAGANAAVTPAAPTFAPNPVGPDSASVSVTSLGETIFTGAGTFAVDFTLAADAAAGDFLVVQLFRDGAGTFGNGATVSNLSIVADATAIPEPSGIALFGLVGLGLVGRRRRS